MSQESDTLLGGLEALDELCLQHVATYTDSLRDLLSLGGTCRRLRGVVTAADPAWQRRILEDFGLLVKGTSLKRQYDVLRHVAAGEPPPPPPPSPPPQPSASGLPAPGPGGADGLDDGPFSSEVGAAAALTPASAPVTGAGTAGPTGRTGGEVPAGSGSGGGGGGSGTGGGGVRPFLPFAGVVTDGGCDTPVADFWVGHLFTPSARTFYSSEAQTRNVHCLAVLQPSGTSQEDPHRTFLLDRLQLPAAYLSRDVMRSIMTDQAWEGGPGQEPPDPLPPLPPHAVEEARRVLSQCATEVLEDLYVHCYNQMTQGRAWGMLLVRSLHHHHHHHHHQHGLHHHHPQPHHQPPLHHAAGPDHDQALHDIHFKAWQIWHNQRSVPYKIRQAAPHRDPRLLFGAPPLRPLLQAAREGAALPRTVGLFDSVLLSRQLNVTCPVRCGALLAATALPAGPSSSSAAAAAAGHIASASSAAAPASGPSGSSEGGHGGPRDRGGGSGPDWRRAGRSEGALQVEGRTAAGVSHAGPHAGGMEDPEGMDADAAVLAQEVMAGLAALPCVRALNDATDIRAILAACRAGLLPPVAGYFTNGWLEWVEFERPDTAASGVTDEPHPHAPSLGPAEVPAAGSAAAAASAVETAPAGSDGGGGGQAEVAAVERHRRTTSPLSVEESVPSLHLADRGIRCRVMPVLWFRFSTREERRNLRRRGASAAAAAAAGPAGAGAGAGGGAGTSGPVAAAAAAAVAAEAELAEADEQLAAAQALLQELQQVAEELELQGQQAGQEGQQAGQQHEGQEEEGQREPLQGKSETSASAARGAGPGAAGGSGSGSGAAAPAAAEPVQSLAAAMVAALEAVEAAHDSGGSSGGGGGAPIHVDLEGSRLVIRVGERRVFERDMAPAMSPLAAAAVTAAVSAARGAGGQAAAMLADSGAAARPAGSGCPGGGGAGASAAGGVEHGELEAAAEVEVTAAAAAAAAAAGPSEPGVGAGGGASGSCPPCSGTRGQEGRGSSSVQPGDGKAGGEEKEEGGNQEQQHSRGRGSSGAGAGADADLAVVGPLAESVANGCRALGPGLALGEGHAAEGSGLHGDDHDDDEEKEEDGGNPDVEEGGEGSEAAAAEGGEVEVGPPLPLDLLSDEDEYDEEDDDDDEYMEADIDEGDELEEEELEDDDEDEEDFDVGFVVPWPMAGGGPQPGGGAAAAAALSTAAAMAAAAAAACNAQLAEAQAEVDAEAAAGGSAGRGRPGQERLVAQAVINPAMPIFPISPNLTALAPGIGHVYGWAAPAAADHMVQIRLRQPWCANMLLAKLISCEDLQPGFNRDRGGCNLDAGIITVQGPAAPGGEGGGPLVRLLDGVTLL